MGLHAAWGLPPPSLFQPHPCCPSSRSMDHLSLLSAVQVGESGGVPYVAAFAALHPQRTQALLLLAGLAAVHGSENASLRKCLSAMDRFSVNWAARLGGARLISHVVKLAADVSAGSGLWRFWELVCSCPHCHR